MSVLILTLFSQSASALTISPAIKEFELDPGGGASGQVLVRNDEAKTVQISVSTKNFESAGDGGEPKFIDLSGDLADWIKLSDSSFSLAPTASRRISYAIEIPRAAPPGGHFAGILITGQVAGAPEGSGAMIENQLASLMLVRVSGDVIEAGRIKEFFIDTRSLRGVPPFSRKGRDDEAISKSSLRQPADRDDLRTFPIKFSVRFENFGNVFLKPYGAIKVKNWFGKQIAELAINDQGGNVLPKSGRRFDALWEGAQARAGIKKPLLGKYKAELEMFYGTENKKESAQINFWLINREGAILAFVIMLGAAFLVWRIVKKMRGRRFFVERI